MVTPPKKPGGSGSAELTALIIAAQGGDSAAVAALFDRFQPLVLRVLATYRTPRLGAFMEDQPGEAFVCFVELVRRYDPGRGVPFAAYIEEMLAGSLHTVIRRQWRIRAR